MNDNEQWNVHDARYLAHTINGVHEELEDSVMPAIPAAGNSVHVNWSD